MDAAPSFDSVCSSIVPDAIATEFRSLDEEGKQRIRITCDYMPSTNQEDVFKYGTAVTLETLRMKIEKKWLSNDMSNRAHKACFSWMCEKNLPFSPVHEWYTKHGLTIGQMEEFYTLMSKFDPFTVRPSSRVICMYKALSQTTKTKIDGIHRRNSETDRHGNIVFVTLAGCDEFIESVMHETLRSEICTQWFALSCRARENVLDRIMAIRSSDGTGHMCGTDLCAALFGDWYQCPHISKDQMRLYHQIVCAQSRYM